MEKEKKVNQSGKWEGTSWIWDRKWRRMVRGREEGELLELQKLLEGWSPRAGVADKMKWKLSKDEIFTVKELKDLVDDKILISIDRREEVTDWCDLAPKKINVFWWRLRLGRLPVRWKLDQLGMDLDSVLCPRCGSNIETVDHALFECSQVKEIWKETFRWWGIQTAGQWSMEVLRDPDNNRWKLGGRSEKWKATVWCLAYLIWKHQNEIVFEKTSKKLHEVWFEIQVQIYNWIKHRMRDKRLSWNEWMLNPGLA